MSKAMWKYQINGQEHGPIDTKQLQLLAKTGKLKPTDLIWREGLKDWVPASKAKGLFPTETTPDLSHQTDSSVPLAETETKSDTPKPPLTIMDYFLIALMITFVVTILIAIIFYIVMPSTTDFEIAAMKAINQRLTYPGEHYHWAFISAEEGYDLAATAFFEAQNAFGATRKMRAGVVGKKEGDKWSITILFVEPYVSY